MNDILLFSVIVIVLEGPREADLVLPDLDGLVSQVDKPRVVGSAGDYWSR